jgi:hypothetical protein
MADLFTEPANLNLEAHLVQVFEDYVLARAQASPAAVRSERPLREKSAAVYGDVRRNPRFFRHECKASSSAGCRQTVVFRYARAVDGKPRHQTDKTCTENSVGKAQ